MRYLYFVGFLSFCFIPGLSNTNDRWSVFRDETGELSFDIALDSLNDSKPVSDSVFNFGLTKDIIWLKKEIISSQPSVLLLKNPLIRYVEVYLIEEDKVISHKSMEYLRDIETGLRENTQYVFDIPPRFEGQCVLKIYANDPLVIPLEWIPHTRAMHKIMKEVVFGYFIIGSVLVLIVLYLIFLYHVKRSHLLLLYSLRVIWYLSF